MLPPYDLAHVHGPGSQLNQPRVLIIVECQHLPAQTERSSCGGFGLAAWNCVRHEDRIRQSGHEFIPAYRKIRRRLRGLWANDRQHEEAALPNCLLLVRIKRHPLRPGRRTQNYRLRTSKQEVQTLAFHRRVKPASNHDARITKLTNRVVRLGHDTPRTTDRADQSQVNPTQDLRITKNGGV